MTLSLRVSCRCFALSLALCPLVHSAASEHCLSTAGNTRDSAACVGSESLLQRDTSSAFAHDSPLAMVAEAMAFDQLKITQNPDTVNIKEVLAAKNASNANASTSNATADGSGDSEDADVDDDSAAGGSGDDDAEKGEAKELVDDQAEASAGASPIAIPASGKNKSSTLIPNVTSITGNKTNAETSAGAVPITIPASGKNKSSTMIPNVTSLNGNKTNKSITLVLPSPDNKTTTSLTLDMATGRNKTNKTNKTLDIAAGMNKSDKANSSTATNMTNKTNKSVSVDMLPSGSPAEDIAPPPEDQLTKTEETENAEANVTSSASGESPDNSSDSIKFQVRIPMQIAKIHASDQGPLAKFLLALKAALVDVSGVSEDRLNVLGIRGDYMKFSLLMVRERAIVVLDQHGRVQDPDPAGSEAPALQATEKKTISAAEEESGSFSAGASAAMATEAGDGEPKKKEDAKAKDAEPSGSAVDVEILPASSSDEPTPKEVVAKLKKDIDSDSGKLKSGALKPILKGAKIMLSPATLSKATEKPAKAGACGISMFAVSSGVIGTFLGFALSIISA